MTKPITPKEARAKSVVARPPEVFEAFNELIAKHLDPRGTAKVLQKDAAALIASKLDITTGAVYEQKYLDIETTYEKAGWEVRYDKPGWDESYDAFFVFKAPRTRD